jgi:hypothetical protein
MGHNAEIMVCMLIAESTWKFMICFHVDSAMSVFDDFLFGDEHYSHRGENNEFK